MGDSVVDEVIGEDELRAGPPRERLRTAFLTSAGREYDVHPDGERLVLGGQSRVLPSKMIVVLNWVEELKRLVPTER